MRSARYLEGILALHAVGIFGNSMPGDPIMSRRQRRRQGNDELPPIPWIIPRHASRDGFPSFVLEFQARKLRYHALAEVQLDLLRGDLARNIGCGANRLSFG